MRAALYHRVSTLEQDPAGARAELRASAERMGARVVLEVEETGSGALNNRPGLLEVLEAARRGRIELVLVVALDRWGRSPLDLLTNLRELEGAGVRFVALRQGLDLRGGGDAMSRLMLSVLAGVAEFERELGRERTRAGVARARARGARLGRPRVALPEHAAVLELRSCGASWPAIAAELGCSTWAARQVLT